MSGNLENRTSPGRAKGPVLLLALFLALTGGTGCASRSGQGAPGETYAQMEVHRLNLISLPVAVNFDRLPGAEGFGLTLYATNHKKPKAVPITEGRLEIALYDGMLKADEPTPEPLRLWSFPAEVLPAHRVVNSLGTGYRFALRWEARKPTRSRITVQGRYISPAGTTLFTSPAVITMLAE